MHIAPWAKQVVIRTPLFRHSSVKNIIFTDCCSSLYFFFVTLCMMFKRLLFLLIISFLLTAATGCTSMSTQTDSLLSELHNTIQDRESYLAQKESRLNELRQKLYSATDDTARFFALGDLLDEFRPYNTDSAFTYCKKREILAYKTGNPEFITNSRLNTANVLGSIGMYKEALEIVDSIPYSSVPDYLLPYYYYINQTIASYLADFSVRKEDKDKYLGIFEMYQDSLLSRTSPNSLSYVIGMSGKYLRKGNAAKSVEILENYLANNEYSTHDRAIVANTLSFAYKGIGNKEKQKENLIISSIADLQASVREYVSLRQLATILFMEGDIDNAYEFLSIAMDDAQKCNARQRILEINDIYPIVNAAFVKEIQLQRERQLVLIIIISILAVFLLAAIVWIWKQMKKTSAAHQQTIAANNKLKQLNAELENFNNRLTEANHAIAENSKIKEEYISQYMEQCSSYIEKLDAYRKSLNKLSTAGNIENLKKILKSTDITDVELKAFYRNFDATFLKLFPTFVEDFNKLLTPEGQIVLKKPGQLNTELRIFALIRLGIKDSEKIAKFLRYSVITIYNYRVKTRNKAAGNRKELEERVMEIGCL